MEAIATGGSDTNINSPDHRQSLTKRTTGTTSKEKGSADIPKFPHTVSVNKKLYFSRFYGFQSSSLLLKSSIVFGWGVSSRYYERQFVFLIL